MPSHTVFIAGAGVSLPAPSRLPLFSHLQRAILNGLDDRLQVRAAQLSPEPLLRAANLAVRSFPELLVESFSRADSRPNIAHYTLASRLIQGDVVWTTNYDTLIADAVEELTAGMPRHQVKLVLGRLRQPHGKFLRTTPEAEATRRWDGHDGLIFHADQVVVEWEATLAKKLVEDVKGRPLVIAGYSGVDVNSYGSLRAAIQEAASVRWYWYDDGSGSPSAWEEVTFRYPNIASTGPTLSLNPALALLADFAPGLDLGSTELDARFRRAPDEGCAADLPLLSRSVTPPLSQSVIARELGERRAEVSLLDRSTTNGWNAVRPRLAHVRHHPRIQAIRETGRSAIRSLPAWTPATTKLRSRTIADVPAESLDHAVLMTGRVERWIDLADPSIYRVRLETEMSRLLRYQGRYEEAIGWSGRAMDAARRAESPAPTEAGRSMNEQIEALRTVGRFDEAFEVVRTRLQSLAMAHWGAWADYQRGCLHLQLREFDRAQRFLSRSDSFFSSIDLLNPSTTYDPGQGQVFVGIALAAHARSVGNLGEATDILDSLRPMHSVALARPLLQSLDDFQRAEIERGHSRFSEAAARYESMDPGIEIFGGLSWLGRALCELGTGDDPSGSLESAIRGFVRTGSDFGLGYCVAIERMAGLTIHTNNVGWRDGAWTICEGLFGKGKPPMTVSTSIAYV